ncbi:hypothetical protein Tco_1515571 [Tanacetum coccineum]
MVAGSKANHPHATDNMTLCHNGDHGSYDTWDYKDQMVMSYGSDISQRLVSHSHFANVVLITTPCVPATVEISNQFLNKQTVETIMIMTLKTELIFESDREANSDLIWYELEMNILNWKQFEVATMQFNVQFLQQNFNQNGLRFVTIVKQSEKGVQSSREYLTGSADTELRDCMNKILEGTLQLHGKEFRIEVPNAALNATVAHDGQIYLAVNLLKNTGYLHLWQ